MSHMSDLLTEYGVYRKRMREDDDEINVDGDDEFEFDLDNDADGEPDATDFDDEMDNDEVDFDYDDDGEEDDHEDHHGDVEDRLDDLESKLTQILSQMAAIVADRMDGDDDKDGELFDPSDDADADDDELDAPEDEDDLDLGDEKVKEYEDRLNHDADMDDYDYEEDGDFNIEPYGAINKKKLARRQARYKKHRYTEDDESVSGEDYLELEDFSEALRHLGAARCEQLKMDFMDFGARTQIKELLNRAFAAKADGVDPENIAIALLACITGDGPKVARDTDRVMRNS